MPVSPCKGYVASIPVSPPEEKDALLQKETWPLHWSVPVK